MRVGFDPRLVEEVVHLLAMQDPERWRMYRRTVDPVYERDDRDDGFAAVLLDLFRSWRAAEACEEALGLTAAADRALVARSRHPGDEGADLLVGSERTVLVRVAAERFLEPDRLRILLRHEMRHVADMLDPAFGYEPDLGLRGRTRAETELARTRYRVLWDLAIDRIETPPVPRPVRLAELDRAFATLEPPERALLTEAFERSESRRHAMLAAAARDPCGFLGLERHAGPVPGEPCPLCGFPTYDWADTPPVRAIQADYPGWRAADGVCGQCALIYAARAPA